MQSVAKQANLKDYEVRVYPEPKNFMEVVEEVTDGDRDLNHLALPASGIASSRESSILDLALPYLKGLDRQRPANSQSSDAATRLAPTGIAVLLMPDISIRDSSR